MFNIPVFDLAHGCDLSTLMDMSVSAREFLQNINPFMKQTAPIKPQTKPQEEHRPMKPNIDEWMKQYPDQYAGD